MIIIPYSINRKADWDEFVTKSKNATFLFQRGFMDYHADRFFDCSLLIYDYHDSSEDIETYASSHIIALFPANWNEKERCVYSHQGLTYGGLLLRDETTQKEVMVMLQSILQYYKRMMNAERLVYKPIPYIYSAYPSEEDLYALFRANATVRNRLVSTVICLRNVMPMRTLRQRGARKAIDHGCYIDRMNEGDWDTLREYWTLLEDVLRTHHDATPVHSFEEIQLLMERFPREIRLYLVRVEGRIVAGTVIFETKHVAHVQYIASGDEGREFGALDLLFRHLINERFKQMEYLDLGTSNEDGGHVLNEGLIFQKEGFGGRAVCYDAYEIRMDDVIIDGMNGIPNTESSNKIPFLDLKQINNLFEPTLTNTVSRVVQSGWYLLGEETFKFEQMFSEYCGATHCVLTANGLEALTLILKAWRQRYGWEEGDEVIVPSNTYIATILAVTNAGLTPVLCEPELRTCLIDPNLIESCITPRTRAILPVHLYGFTCDMKRICEIAKQYHLMVMDDAAQAHGAMYKGNRVGHLCDATAFSFYPTKNLGALGDAGAVVTDDEELATLVRQMANYGSVRKYVNEYKGMNSRIDEIQAAALSIKLPLLDTHNQRRREIALQYQQQIVNPLVTLPYMPDDITESVYHIYPVRCPNREALQQYLESCHIHTMVHYPIPPHKQKAYQEWNDLSFPISERIHREIVSLPIAPTLTDEQVQKVIEAVNDFVWEM